MEAPLLKSRGASCFGGKMLENAFYKIKPEFFDTVEQLGGKYTDRKQRPVFCCVEDAHIKSLFWAIPTSDLSHRSAEQITKIKSWCGETGIRSAYYHIGHTNRPALYRISSCFPIIENYIETPYLSNGIPLILKNQKEITIIRTKLSRILFDESRHPDKYEQHISTIRNYLSQRLLQQEHPCTEEQEHTPFNDCLVQTVRNKECQVKRITEKDPGPER